jgi:predicted nucleotidyltransferase
MLRQTAIDLIRAHEGELRALGVAGCDLFGSVARGEAQKDSDVDVAVRLDAAKRVTLFDLAEVSHRLEQLLGTKVDLVSEGGLKPRFKARIDADRLHVF